MTDPQHRALARLALRRVAVPRTAPAHSAPRIVSEPWPSSKVPYSRTLWGTFLPERRASGSPWAGTERRRG